MVDTTKYDVVIVGSGFAGANMALLLANKGRRVLILEAGPGLEHSREDYMENFYLNTFKSPSSPYPPNDNGRDPAHTNVSRPTIQDLVDHWDDPTKSYFTYPASNSLPFASTYERLAGGTGNHWMGTCLRMTDSDFKLKSSHSHGLDWPIGYAELEKYYGLAEHYIGVSADKSEQEKLPDLSYQPDYAYPMRGIPKSNWDKAFAAAVNEHQLTADNTTLALVTSTPAGRNSEPFQSRRVCHGNTNCTPMCPIQAKYDPQYTLSLAMDTGNVTFISKAVVDYVTVDSATGLVQSVHYITYDDISVPARSGATGGETAIGTIFVLAAHAVENARILLNSAYQPSGIKVANSTGLVGQNLMDHPVYLAWGLMPLSSPIFGYRGPLSTSGVENLRTGHFRSSRAAWRIEIGNEGWNWPAGDPYTSGLDYVYGINNGGLNPSDEILANIDYVEKLNSLLTRQFRMGFLVEQDAEQSNCVKLSDSHFDNLGIRRPLVTYNLSNYTKEGFKSAREAAKKIMELLKAKDYTKTDPKASTYFTTEDGEEFNYQGAGHLCGTHIMGTNKTNSVVDSYQKSWDHPNLYLAGCGSMPSIGTQNPSLTMLALACRTVDDIATRL